MSKNKDDTRISSYDELPDLAPHSLVRIAADQIAIVADAARTAGVDHIRTDAFGYHLEMHLEPRYDGPKVEDNGEAKHTDDWAHCGARPKGEG